MSEMVREVAFENAVKVQWLKAIQSISLQLTVSDILSGRLTVSLCVCVCAGGGVCLYWLTSVSVVDEGVTVLMRNVCVYWNEIVGW
jgi:hypothetical protein